MAAAVVGGVSACSPLAPADPDRSETTHSGLKVDVGQHETFAGTPIAFTLTVPEGTTQLGPLVRRRTPELVAAYQPVLAEAERRQAIEAAEEAAEDPDATTPTPTEPLNPLPTTDTFAILTDPPEPDVTTALLRVDGDPGEVFSEVVDQVASLIPDLGLDADTWSQFCTAVDGLYTSCSFDVTGRTTDDIGVRVAVTLDPGNLRKKQSPAGSQGRPVMTYTAVATDPPDMRPAWQALDEELEAPGDAETPEPPVPEQIPATTTPLAAQPEVDAEWPDLPVSRPVTTGGTLVTQRWRLRDDSALLLSGDKPAFASILVERGVNADAIARSYVLSYSTAGEPTQDVIEDRTEISTTYRAVTRPGGPSVSATFTQAGRGNYIALFYLPPARA
ncbi:hypothetical protein FE697_013885 [Mumia zhuanghuii]|uniref:Uncharacterized protein n=1 Tax=Mumia zhuanghuii TaxID=2585211 RepID=A0A5Q6RW80_9ACTN|nr:MULTISPECIES: hypothetical protein [Mumia]KAA1422250.1 hypothetical protein FE697_013885 [Mumia zhuanghuii]